jgi:hypothetical protein
MNRNPEEQTRFSIREYARDHHRGLAVFMAGAAFVGLTIEVAGAAEGHSAPKTVVTTSFSPETSDETMTSYEPVDLSCPSTIPEGTISNIPASKKTYGITLKNQIDVNNIMACLPTNELFAKVTEVDSAITKKHGKTYSTALKQKKVTSVTLNLQPDEIISTIVEPNDTADDAHLHKGGSAAAYNSSVANLTKNGIGFLKNDTSVNGKLAKGYSAAELRDMDAHLPEMGVTASRIDTDLSLTVAYPESVSEALSSFEEQAKNQLEKEYHLKTANVSIAQLDPSKEFKRVLAVDDDLPVYKTIRFTQTKVTSAEPVAQTELVLIESDGIRTTVIDPSFSLTSTQIGTLNTELKSAGYN